MAQPAVPNFFLVGAARAGTTSLVHYLEQHPAVYMSPLKEPMFFTPEVADVAPALASAAAARELHAWLDGPLLEKRMDGLVREWADYVKLFRRVTTETAVGEASVAYLSSPHAAAAIRARIPHARILMVLRDPADRLFSQYLALGAAGAVRGSFTSWLTKPLAEEAAQASPWGHIQVGRYAQHLARFREHFPSDRIWTGFYDDYQREPALLLKRMLRFLDVDDSLPIDVTMRHNVTAIPRWPGLVRALPARLRRRMRPPVPMRAVRGMHTFWFRDRSGVQPTRDERAKAIALYEADIHALAALTGRDLSGWLDARPPVVRGARGRAGRP